MSDHSGNGRADPRAISRRSRAIKERVFVAICILGALTSVVLLGVLLSAIVYKGWSHLTPEFLQNYASRRPSQAGIRAAMWGTLWVCAVCAVVALPLGVGTAVFLEEYKPRRRLAQRLHGFIQLNITNLAGVPSIVYGIIGLTVFVRMFGLFGSANVATYDDMHRYRLTNGRIVMGDSAVSDTPGVRVLMSPRDGRIEVPESEIRSERVEYVRTHTFQLADGSRVSGSILSMDGSTVSVDDRATGATVEFTPADVRDWSYSRMLQIGDEHSFFYFRLPLGGSVLAGGLTLMLVILPIVIVSTQEALRAVPPSLREGSFALGSTRWQMVSRMILPASTPGMMTGAILAMSRAIGEAAPLLIVTGIVFIMFTPTNLMSDFASMPLQIYNWAGRPQAEFQNVAAAGIIVLLAVLLAFNAVAILIRQKFQKPLQ